MFLGQIFSNNVIRYLLGRYFVYALQLFNSLLIAVHLGPLYLGVWGFINLVIQYFGQLNLGIPASVNAIMSIEKDVTADLSKTVSSAVQVMIFLSVAAGLFFFFNHCFSWGLGSKFRFERYSLFVLPIIVMNYFVTVYVNVFRVFGKLFEISFSQSVVPIITSIGMFFFRGEPLIIFLLYATAIGSFLALLLFIIKAPVRIQFTIEWQSISMVTRTGFYLFIFACCFYLIMVTTRTFIGSYYSVEDFGNFTFAFMLASIITLLLDSFSVLVFPKVLNKFSKLGDSQGLDFLRRIRTIYVVCCHFLVYFLIMIFPIFLWFFPQYSGGQDSFRAVAITIALYTSAFGYQGLLIVRRKEKELALVSLAALVLNLICCYIFIVFFKFDYSLIVFATAIVYFLMVCALSVIGKRTLKVDHSVGLHLRKDLPSSLMLPLLLTVILIFVHAHNLLFILPNCLFILLNYKNYKEVRDAIQDLIRRPSIINF